jgi:hypothetical protein
MRQQVDFPTNQGHFSLSSRILEVNHLLFPWLFLAMLLLGGCSTSSEVPPRPANFRVTYQWVETSLPRPYHYEYTIRIGPGLQGVIEYQPDYTFPTTPIWTETFELEDKDLENIYTLMGAKGVFTRFWRPVNPQPDPGELGPLVVIVDEQRFIVPAYTVDGPADGEVLDIYDALHALVPAATWQKLETRHQQYMQDFVAGREATSPETVFPKPSLVR